MIEFSCLCGYAFQVPQDLAGGLIQCPQCKRLCDVPLLSDLANIDSQGIYKLDASPPRKDNPERVAKLTYVFTREHYDAEGNPIDNRGWYESRAGRGPAPPAPSKSVPKYDPITGELVRELDIKPDDAPDPATIPIARPAVVPPPTVVNGMDVPSPLEVFAIPLRLFLPINLLVMGFILLGHMLAQAMMVAIATWYFVLVPFWFILQCLAISHFGNVIDETGPTSRSELPTPLRSVNWHDDTFGPFARIVLALLVCYGPSALTLFTVSNVPVQYIISLSAILGIIGTLLFPAAAMTSITSGSSLNLRPDRIVGTAIACGAEYVIAMITWAIGGGMYVFGVLAVNAIGADALQDRSRLPAYLTWYIAYGALALGIYLLHFLGWHLGTLYRRNHERFPWLYQRHFSERRTIAPAAGFPVARPSPHKPVAPPGSGA